MSRPALSYPAAATPPAETQGVQGLPNLMKAIDWAIAKYPSGTVFSMSFGTDEQAFGSKAAAAAQFAKFDATFKRGLAKHETFFSSSGDTGSVGVVRSHRASTSGATPEVSYPNVSPYVTSVGDTQVQSGWTWNPAQDKPFLDTGARNPLYWEWTTGGRTEAVWNESWASIGTGGGLSTVCGPPAYQDPVPPVVGSMRGVPDVAWNAAGRRSVVSAPPSSRRPTARHRAGSCRTTGSGTPTRRVSSRLTQLSAIRPRAATT